MQVQMISIRLKSYIPYVLIGLMIFLNWSCQKDQGEKGQIVLTDPILLQDAGDIPILLDGLFSPGEWDDALRLRIDPKANLLIKTKKGHLFIGIKCTDLKIPVADIYLATENRPIYQLHASAQLGERVLSEEHGSENDPPFHWGDTRDWYANEVRWNNSTLTSIMETEGISREEAFSRAVYPYEGFEFQIKQSKFQTNELWIRIEVSYEDSYDNPIVIPVNTERKIIDNWIKLVFK